MSGSTGLSAALLAAAVLVMLWFTDAWVVPDEAQREVMTNWRVSMIGISLIAAGCLWLLQRWGRDPRPLMVGGCLFAAGLSYALFSEIGGPGTPWIHASAVVPLASLGLLVRPLVRASVVAGVGLTCFGAYYGPHPEYLADPFAWNVITMLVTSTVFSGLLGHYLYALSRSNFEQRVELTRLATVDPLTGVANRRAFLERAEAESWRARRYRQPLSVLMLDLDRFKRVNDLHGHGAGDTVLRVTTTRLQGQLRQSDLLGRLGGEEFAILLPQTDLVGAVELADRLRLAVGEEPFATADAALTVTVSVGVAQVDLGVEEVQGGLRRADLALYRSKAAGRNRVSCSPGLEDPVDAA